MTATALAPARAPGSRSPAPRVTALARALPAIPLLAIAAAQVALTIRLMPYAGSDPGDEIIYVYGGHQLIGELLHGGGSPYYETWYSGAPVIYPVLAAVADSLGGLLLARALSLVFMLCATALLFLAARRLLGYWTAVTAAALFAGLGMTQSLGALATYDAMSLMLLAAAAYCAVRATGSARWLLLVPAALLAANAVKYVTVLFDPVVVGIAAVQLLSCGRRAAARRALALSAATGLAIAVTAFIAGSAYVSGIMYTTLSRKAGTQPQLGAHAAPAAQAVSLSWEWMGAVIALAAVALLISLPQCRDRRHAPLLALLLAAGVLVTLGNIRLHTAQSMDKHDDFSAWFACIPAAYALTYAAGAARRARARVPALALATVAVVACGYCYSQPASLSAYFSFAPAAAYEQGTYGFLGPYLRVRGGEYLLASEHAQEVPYIDGVPMAWQQFFDDTYIKYPVPGRSQGMACGGPGQPPAGGLRCAYLEGAAGYEQAIRAHWFALVTLVGNHGLSSDNVILAAVRSTPGYVLLTTAGGEPTYIYAPDYPAWEKAHPAALGAVRAAAGRY